MIAAKGNSLLKKAMFIAAALAVSACSETVYNASPSVFPPVEGPIALPSQAGGFYQGRNDEFIRQLSDAEQIIWDEMGPAQRKRAARFIRAGGTLTSSLRPDI